MQIVALATIMILTFIMLVLVSFWLLLWRRRLGRLLVSGTGTAGALNQL